jgi:hypothetical protein
VPLLLTLTFLHANHIVHRRVLGGQWWEWAGSGSSACSGLAGAPSRGRTMCAACKLWLQGMSCVLQIIPQHLNPETLPSALNTQMSRPCRDIKPENVFFTADGGLRLGDFGLSIDAARERPTSRVGTLDYMCVCVGGGGAGAGGGGAGACSSSRLAVALWRAWGRSQALAAGMTPSFRLKGGAEHRASCTRRAPEVVGMPSPDDIQRLGLAPNQIGHYGCKVSGVPRPIWCHCPAWAAWLAALVPGPCAPLSRASHALAGGAGGRVGGGHPGVRTALRQAAV